MRAARLARLHGAVDRDAGELVAVTPLADGGYLVGTPDPSRPAQPIFARVTEVPKLIRATGHGATSGHTAELRSASHAITYSTSALPYALTRGDQVTLIDRGGLLLAVNTVEPFGTDRTTARLETLKSPT